MLILILYTYVFGIYAEFSAGFEAEVRVVSETNNLKWQTFNEWTCNAPTFSDFGDVATYISHTVAETWGPLAKDRERILSFGFERRHNGTQYRLETWIYSPESWRKLNSLQRPPTRIGYRILILLGGFQVTENSGIVWLDDVWLFSGDKVVWNEINVYNQHVAVQAQDTDSNSTCKESVFFFTSRNRNLSFHKLRCVNDGRVYAWEKGNSSRVPRDCSLGTISYNPTTFYILAMARGGLWRYSPSEDYWQLVNVSVKSSRNGIGIHFKTDRRLADRYVLFENGVSSEYKHIWIYKTFQRRWYKGTIVGFHPYFYSFFPSLAILWGRLVAYTSTDKLCNYILWDIRPDKEKQVWTWSKTQSQRRSPPSTIGQLASIVGDHLYVIGGTLSENFYDQWIRYRTDVTDFWQLNLNEMMWERLTPLPNRWAAMNTAQASASGGTLYTSMLVVCREIMGLKMGPSTTFDTRAYLFESRVWVEYIGVRKPSPRNHHSMVAINESSLLMFGGQGDFYKFLQETWIMTLPEANSSTVYWSQIAQNSSNIPDARYRHTLVFMNSGLVVLYGGFNASGHCLTDIWFFNVTRLMWKSVFPVNRGPQPLKEKLPLSWNGCRTASVYYSHVLSRCRL